MGDEGLNQVRTDDRDALDWCRRGAGIKWVVQRVVGGLKGGLGRIEGVEANDYTETQDEGVNAPSPYRTISRSWCSL